MKNRNRKGDKIKKWIASMLMFLGFILMSGDSAWMVFFGLLTTFSGVMLHCYIRDIGIFNAPI